MKKTIAIRLVGATLLIGSKAIAGGYYEAHATKKERRWTEGSPAITYYQNEETEAMRMTSHMKERKEASRLAYKAQKKKWKMAGSNLQRGVDYERHKSKTNFYQDQYSDLVESYQPQF